MKTRTFIKHKDTCPKVYPAPRGDIPQPQRSSGSDHKRSHIGPSCGTSWTRSKFLILSRVSIDGDNPPCKQKISDSTYTKAIILHSLMTKKTPQITIETPFIANMSERNCVRTKESEFYKPMRSGGNSQTDRWISSKHWHFHTYNRREIFKALE